MLASSYSPEVTRFISDNLEYSDEMKELNLMGEVIISFIVGLKGSLIEIKVEKSLHQLYDNEAMRVISLMNKWKPAIKKGVPIKSSYKQIIFFEPNRAKVK